MNKYECTEEEFLNNVKDHSIEIIKDDGVHRHIKFSNNGSSSYRIDLITWPGCLCIRSDCGTYVFSRTIDMFEFFRTEDRDISFSKDGLSINPGYWGEKLLSVGTHAGYKEFSEEKFRDEIKYRFDYHVVDNNLNYVDARNLWMKIEHEIFSKLEIGPEHAFQAAYEFDSIDYSDDFPSCNVYTFHFIWCLYAIVWGIKKYDEQKRTNHD